MSEEELALWRGLVRGIQISLWVWCGLMGLLVLDWWLFSPPPEPWPPPIPWPPQPLNPGRPANGVHRKEPVPEEIA